jgi:hypothetical protein
MDEKSIIMIFYQYKFKASTVIKIYAVWIILSVIAIFPIAYYLPSYSFMGILICFLLLDLSKWFFIARAKKKGEDLNKPI